MSKFAKQNLHKESCEKTLNEKETGTRSKTKKIHDPPLYK